MKGQPGGLSFQDTDGRVAQKMTHFEAEGPGRGAKSSSDWPVVKKTGSTKVKDPIGSRLFLFARDGVHLYSLATMLKILRTRINESDVTATSQQVKPAE